MYYKKIIYYVYYTYLNIVYAAAAYTVPLYVGIE